MTPTKCVSLQVVKAEMVLWTAGFVLLTLVINAPLLPWVLRVTGLNKGTDALLHAPDAHSPWVLQLQLMIRASPLFVCWVLLPYGPIQQQCELCGRSIDRQAEPGLYCYW